MHPHPHNRTASNPRQSRGLTGFGFTLVELLVVILIIVVLMGILIPLVASARTQAKVAATKSLLTTLSTALQSYYNDFTMYPSSATSATYGTDEIPEGRGPCMLAQGLMGYLPLSRNSGDPVMGFRVGNSTYGKIYGPYMTNDTKHYRVYPDNQQVFIDTFGNEILYYRAAIPAGTMPDPMYVFGGAGNNNSYFIADDNTKIRDAKGVLSPISGPNALPLTQTAIFFQSLGIYENTIQDTHATPPVTNSPAMLLGRDSYLLVSAGPDGKYFTKDDIVEAKR